MCGISGIVDLKRQQRSEHFHVIAAMNKLLYHRGPDGAEVYVGEHFTFGFCRLSIIDLAGGMQPQTNEDGSLILVCNGEIFNYLELREVLEQKGHRFKTNSDVEVILHLYEEYGEGLLDKLNGQFGFALYDTKKERLFCARDHFGIVPFYYAIHDGFLIFASEVKAILAYPGFKKEVDLVGLDQVFSFPGIISPRTMFAGVASLKNGHYLVAENGSLAEKEYWDLNYPDISAAEAPGRSEAYYAERLNELLTASIRVRLRADVPVGIYLSGGLDSSYIACKAKELAPHLIKDAYSITFQEKEISERKYQQLVVDRIGVKLHHKEFLYSDITSRLPDVIYHCECPLKETYNAASMALSGMVKAHNYRVILSGEGADEFFAGYVGYKFDHLRALHGQPHSPEEEQIRQRIWGDRNFFYEKNKFTFTQTKKKLYANSITEKYEEVNCLHHFIINQEKIANRHIMHKRAYLDYKLRLVDHLVADHGDRMGLANSVEVRYPFLDREVAEFAATIPPELKLKDLNEKYILKRAAKNIVPEEIIMREKFGFVAPGSPYILKRNIEYINDMLSYETIKRQGYFDADEVEWLKKKYTTDGFSLNMPFDSDLLIIVLTFGIFLEKFNMPSFT